MILRAYDSHTLRHKIYLNDSALETGLILMVVVVLQQN